MPPELAARVEALATAVADYVAGGQAADADQRVRAAWAALAAWCEKTFGFALPALMQRVAT